MTISSKNSLFTAEYQLKKEQNVWDVHNIQSVEWLKRDVKHKKNSKDGSQYSKSQGLYIHYRASFFYIPISP